MTFQQLVSGAPLRMREQRNTTRRKLNLALIPSGQQISINKIITEFHADEIKTWNLQVKLIAIACLSIIYLAVNSFS
jgi:hypothetical protein